ncbi:MAG: ATP-binding cassette domain-containing protein [Alphaproteobacteria bacterium]|nr:ATP-binding cassette domain-containing protein [Alphaproteobacteria bacterium]
MISIQNLTRRYDTTVAVSGVSTEIQRGEIVGLLGHNGAGKTTVMKIVTGYLEATEGTVVVDGLDVETHRTEVQRRIGYLPENAPLYDEMLVQEYLVMMAELRGVPGAEIGRRVAEAVVATGLADRVLAPIGTLSKGLRQRVGIAQAILHHPDVLVLDEPTNGLDPMQIQTIRELIRELGKRSTIILSTHILQEIEAVCDRVLIMINGHLVTDARLSDLLDTKRVRLELAPGATDVARTLGAVDGVTDVVSLPGVDGGYGVRWHGDAPPVPGLIAAATKAGWTIRSVAPEHRTLETVFKELQADHLARHGGVA